MASSRSFDGQARPENFPHVNDYRNSVVAEMMKNLNYVNMFNHGIGEVRDLLKENQSPAADFNVGLVTAFSAIVHEPANLDTIQKEPETMQKSKKKINENQREMSDVLKNVLKNVQKENLEKLTERQINILEHIVQSPSITLKEMSKRFKVSVKTIQRDYTAIGLLGINIVRKDGKTYGEWVIQPWD